jgi:hypothetical protein
MPQGIIKPTNKILIAGEPIYQEMEVKTVAGMAAGRLVINDTGGDDYHVKVAPAASKLVIGVLDIMADEKLTDMQEDSAGGAPSQVYSGGTQVRIIRGRVRVKLYALSGETIAVGTRLESAANGMVAALDAARSGDTIVAYSLENVTNAISGECGWVASELLV